MNDPKQKLVSVDEVSISKLSVEIKTVSVGRRQMSMALFRQLPRAPLIDLDDGDLRLNGMPWGRVNYHWDRCCYPDERTHIHVLWQRDTTLIQSAVLTEYEFSNKESELYKAIERYHALCRIGALLCALTTTEEIKSDANTIKIGRWEATEEQRACSPLAHMIKTFRDADAVDTSMYGSKEYRRTEIEKRGIELCAALQIAPPKTEEEAWSLLQAWRERGLTLRAAQTRRLALYETRYQELLALEQLFIAA